MEDKEYKLNENGQFENEATPEVVTETDDRPIVVTQSFSVTDQFGNDISSMFTVDFEVDDNEAELTNEPAPYEEGTLSDSSTSANE